MIKELINTDVDKKTFASAVERFASLHQTHQVNSKEKNYRELIPQKVPGVGQQYAFEVDLDKCTGCKACVTACHNENGLDEDETWRSVGLIQGGTSAKPAIQHITTACHHCAEPACMKGCPTLAYTKDEATGIVQHLEDQCFGCQYCILKCPYDVPKYNKKRGIVHKCDMCIGRLSAGQAPACARACPNGAIRITLVDKKDVKAHPEEYVKVPDAPASDYTYPTTKYITNRVFPSNMESVDYYTIKPEHSHLPLVYMLVLTQLSVGAFFAESILRQIINPYYSHAFYLFQIPFALVIGVLALASSILHLGRPHLAFRAILGFKTSWLSREIIALGMFSISMILYALVHWVKFLSPLADGLALSVFFFGGMGITCSIMVYRDTKRPFWDNHLTTIKFILTTVILGSATTLLSAAVLRFISPEISLLNIGKIFCEMICLNTIAKLIIESTIFLHLLERNGLSFFKKTAILLSGPLKIPTRWRFACGIVGGILLPFIFLQMSIEAGRVFVILSLLIFAISLAGELLERYLFFKAVVPLKMPGGN